MEKLETLLRFTVTGLTVWRLSRLLLEHRLENTAKVSSAAVQDAATLRFWACRGLDAVCWISVWMSSQTAIWVTCGLTGLVVSWMAASGLSRLLPREMETPCLVDGDTMRVRNG
jgi:hypothetical protein